MNKLFTAILLFVSCSAYASQTYVADHGSTSWFTPCFPLYSLTSEGAETLTGITASTTDFRISLIADNENTWTDFEGAADLETIATIGTYSSPTNATDIRFGECESEGYYQIQLHDDHLSKSNATWLTILITDAGGSIGDETINIDQNVITLTDIDTSNADALTDIDLDHLFAVAVVGADVADNSFAARLVSDDATADYDSYNNTTDSAEAQQIAIAALTAALSTAQSDLDVLTGADGANIDTDALADIVVEILGAEIEDVSPGYDLQCVLATLFAEAAGVKVTTTGVSIYEEPSGTEERLRGTVSGGTRGTITVTCP